MVNSPPPEGGESSADHYTATWVNTYEALPAGGRGPALIVLQESLGVDQNMRDVCEWFAARGFLASCPNLSWRLQQDPESSTPDLSKAVDDVAGAMDLLRNHPACTGRVGVIGHGLGAKLAYLLAARHKPDAAVAYSPAGIEAALGEAKNISCPLMLHVSDIDKIAAPLPQAKIHVYPNFDPELADLRTVDFLLRALIVKPHSLEAIWAEHIEHEFSTRSTENTLATMVEDAYVNHIPVLTGGVGKTQLREFYSKHFIPQMPPDTTLTPISRTIGDEQIVDEMIFRFTHTIKMDWMLPGVEPTGRRVEVPLVAIVKLRGDKLAHEHIYWDQASVLAQLGLLDRSSLPVAGIESARKAEDPNYSSNSAMRWGSFGTTTA
jgi:carboxymethylenebutenolidase